MLGIRVLLRSCVGAESELLFSVVLQTLSLWSFDDFGDPLFREYGHIRRLTLCCSAALVWRVAAATVAAPLLYANLARRRFIAK